MAGTTRESIRKQLREVGVRGNLPDSLVDEWVRFVRRQSGRRECHNVAQEIEVMSTALAPFVTFMKKQKCVMDWNEDDWCNFLWSFWDAATTNTQAALRCARLQEDEDAWLVMTRSAVFSKPTSSCARHCRRMFIIMSLAVMVGSMFFLYMGEFSGREQLGVFTVFLFACCLLLFTCCCGRGSRQSNDIEDFAETHDFLNYDTPYKPQDEGDENVESSRPPPQDVRTTPGGQQDSELMQALGALSEGNDTGQMFTVPVQTRPTVRFLPPVGAVVKIIHAGDLNYLKGKHGVVKRINDELLEVVLVGGGMVHGLVSESVQLVHDLSKLRDRADLEQLIQQCIGHAHDSATDLQQEAVMSNDKGFYTPLAHGTLEQVCLQAKNIKDMLVSSSARSALFPGWSKTFWREVGKMEPLHVRVKSLLMSFGYLGNGNGTNPRVEELRSKLQELENVGALSHTSALYELGEAAMESQDLDEDQLDGWQDALPPDMKRAGPEIYSSLKSSGARSCRDWINQVIPIEKRGDAQYSELFNLASLVDFKLKMAGGMHSRALAIIAADDTCEIALRRMASFIHLRRTGDKAAGRGYAGG